MERLRNVFKVTEGIDVEAGCDFWFQSSFPNDCSTLPFCLL